MTDEIKTLDDLENAVQEMREEGENDLRTVLHLIRKLKSRPVDGVVINFLPDAVKTVTKAIREDKELYIAYQANIAMPFQDEFKRQMGQIGRNAAIENIHEIANNAAKYFLDLWCKE